MESVFVNKDGMQVQPFLTFLEINIFKIIFVT